MQDPSEFAEPVESELSAQNARSTGPIARLLLVLTLVTSVLISLDPETNSELLVLMSGSAGGLLVLALGLCASGRDRLAAWILCSGLWTITTVGLAVSTGATTQISGWLLVVVVLAGGTLGRRGSVAMGLLAVLSAGGLTWENNSYFPILYRAHPSPFVSVIAYASLVLVTAGVMMAIVGSQGQAIAGALEASQQRDAARIRYLQAQKMEPVGRMAGGIAHDFNNILAVIRGVSEILRLKRHDPDVVLRLLDDLDSATTRANLMTSRLLAFTRNRQEEHEILDLGQVASGIVPLLSRLLGDDIHVEFSVPEAPLWVMADRGQLEQALLNLAVNARDAMPRGGRLTVNIVGRESSAVIEVRDTGVGMAPDVAKSALTPFFTTKDTGTGLGLATVRDIIEGVGGSIEIESEIDRGTLFRLLLPRKEAPPIASDVPSREQEMRGEGRVLLVEDHDLVRRVNCRLLEEMGFEVTPVRDGGEAVALIEGGAVFDAVVSDWAMPRMSGVELAEELGKRGYGIPFILISGNSDLAPPSFSQLPFSTTFLTKPFDPAVLGQSVRQAINAASRAAERPLQAGAGNT